MQTYVPDLVLVSLQAVEIKNLTHFQPMFHFYTPWKHWLKISYGILLDKKSSRNIKNMEISAVFHILM